MIKNDKYVKIEMQELVNIIKNADGEGFEKIMEAFGIKRGCWEEDALCEGATNIAKMCLSVSAGLAEANTINEDFAKIQIEYFAFSADVFRFLTVAEAYLAAVNQENNIFKDELKDDFIEALKNDEFDDDCASYINGCTEGEFFQIIRYLLSGEIRSIGYEWGSPIFLRAYGLIPHGLFLATMAMSVKIFTDPFANLLNKLLLW